MKTITVKSFNQIVFFLCVAIPFLNNYELTFGIWFLALFLTVANRYSVDIIKLTSCYVAILLIAFVVYFFQDEGSYNFFRDLSYLLKPIIGLLLGYQFYKKFPNYVFSTLVGTGTLIAAIHIALVLNTFIQFRSVSVNLLREYGGYFSDYEIYALILVVFANKFTHTISKKNLIIMGILLAFSSFLYLSRTNFIQFIILYMAMKGYFKITKKSVSFMAVTTIFVLMGYAVIYNTNPSRTGKGMEAFLYKIKNAPIEAFKTRVNSSDWKDFNDNYRSYENIITTKQVFRDGAGAVIFGQGLGSRVNLGQEIYTTDGSIVQYIPILHNGFFTVFLKSGLIGVLFLIFSIYLVAKQKKTNFQEIENINRLLIGSSLFLIVSNWVFMGLYLKLDTKSIVIGLLICYREALLKIERNQAHLVEVNPS
ncbi:hypothetical protein GV828_11300 [Flavobacterium sp. NST-5]|uniref:Polysaccharide polymerase n=1 Tax=Flavobacterium ichthyis TaxID=2698827 RepID=A0ABW9ZCF5_9FLAO|nr:hypothetical protein [Flavobacterium ichthyis]NBL65786.1 hypothetical protein [Flavobacterium ichthyis]